MPTVADTLRAATVLGVDRLDAQLLLLHALGRGPGERAWLLAHDGDALSEHTASALEALFLRRTAGEPVAYLVGEKEFFGLPLQVDARVLVPRPDTETLVDWALDLLPADAPAAVVDLGTGSGAIALAIARHRPQAAVDAVDASEAALAVARNNAARLGPAVRFFHGDWLAGAPEPLYTLIVSNPPYIAEGDSHLPALAHEPTSALTAGADGLDDIRVIVRDAPARLAPGGWLLLEHGWDQAAAVRALLAGAGLEEVQSRTDLGGIERCSGARLAGHR
ncbi:peptide chain release factor N(5)-glutamine methyltransferase [Xylophilus sp. GOD-11R]|uniref:peptide chain release factor N(5)-glutamine methyltransferase n=1 Tax=Xylophilus sp. GOD-11R TaxID=3089814 RepID=UPI00298D5294|nr:peptide chain release factor N(5)-glutamine methyltransferase [Xylophilus sp. GOD-11R]WPB55260.1 peptide chain release factor N(5)-glutamine methyltransferase [Xylophilus sp. GOD-11R]